MVETKNGLQMRITDEEKELLKQTFHGRDAVLHTLLEFFIQELDANMLFGKTQTHIYGGIDTEKLNPIDVSIRVCARNDTLNHLKVCISQLWIFSETPFTPAERQTSPVERVQIIKTIFKDNESLLKLMRKIFYPEIDPSAPLEQVIDMFSTIETDDKTAEEVWIKVNARNWIISYIESSLQQLNLMANAVEKTPEQREKESKMNSTK